MWASHTKPGTNVSIGYDCVQSMAIRTATTKLRGTVQSLHIMTKFQGSRFEFIFTSLVKNSPRLFTTVQAVCRAYETTRVYRDVKLRTAIIRDRQLLLLPRETVISRVDRVWNVSADTANLGTLHATNVRLVWFAATSDAYNISVPYVRFLRVRVRASRHGHTLVIDTRPPPGQTAGYVLGFKLDSDDALLTLVEQIGKLFTMFCVKPELGIETVVDDKVTVGNPSSAAVKRAEDDVQVVAAADMANFDALAAFYADGPVDMDREPEYNADLGLAVEKLRNGLEINELWQVTSG